MQKRLWFKYSNQCPVCRTSLPGGLKGYQNHVGNLRSKEELDRHKNLYLDIIYYCVDIITLKK